MRQNNILGSAIFQSTFVRFKTLNVCFSVLLYIFQNTFNLFSLLLHIFKLLLVLIIVATNILSLIQISYQGIEAIGLGSNAIFWQCGIWKQISRATINSTVYGKYLFLLGSEYMESKCPTLASLCIKCRCFQGAPPKVILNRYESAMSGENPRCRS